MRKFARFVLWTAIIVGGIIGVARVFAIRWWRLPENDPYLDASVAPTLEGGDLIVLWRLTKPSFGDLVMCPEPNAPGRIVIGRIMAEEGDSIEIEGDRVVVNGERSAIESNCIEKTFTVKDPANGRVVTQPCSIEAIAGHTAMRGGHGDNKVPPIATDHKVGPGRVFLVSDNRLFPYDSRDFGTVERSTCTESVMFRLVGSGGFYDQHHRFNYIR